MAESRLSEAQALARCDELGLTQGRPREVYALYLVTRWRTGNLARHLDISAAAVQCALNRAGQAEKAWELEQAEKRWSEHVQAIPAGQPIDAYRAMGITRDSVADARFLMDLIQNITPSEPASPLRGKEGPTVHVKRTVRGKRLSPECVAQLQAGTLGGEWKPLLDLTPRATRCNPQTGKAL